MLLLSYLFGLFSFFLYSVAWYLLIRCENGDIGFIVSNYLLTKGNLGKYIPGRIWQFVGRVYLFSNMGFSKARIVMIAVVEQYFILLSAFVIFALAYLNYPHIFLDPLRVNLKLLVIGGLLIGMLSLHPRSIALWNKVVLKITKKEYLQISINFKYVLLVFGIYIIYWVCIGLSVLFLIKGGVKIPIKYMFFIVGVNAIAYIIGYLSLITPGGLGIREGVLTYLLETILVKGFGAIVAIGERVMLMAEEVSFFLLMLILYKFKKKGLCEQKKK